MASCPNCNASLGEEGRHCPSCGWTRRRRRLWIVLGCLAGLLFLCCGGGTAWFYLRAREFAAHMERTGTPLALYTARAQVVNYAHRHGSLPPDLSSAAEEPIVNSVGQEVTVRWFDREGPPRDTWQREIRYTAREDGSFEIRSSGPDGEMDNGDDLVEEGSADEPLDPLVKGLEERAKEVTRKMVEIFGFDPDALGITPAPVPPPEGK